MSLNRFTRTGIMVPTSYPTEYDKTVVSFLMDEDNTPIQGEEFCLEIPTNSLTTRIALADNIVSTPRVRTDTDPIPFDQYPASCTVDITVKTLMLGIAKTATMEKIDLSGRFGDMVKQALAGGRKFLEWSIADLINTAASTNGADGVAGFATNHPSKKPGGPSWSNLALTPCRLDEPSYNAVRVAMLKWKDALGFPSPAQPTFLMHTADDEKKAKQICNSELTPGVVDQSANVARLDGAKQRRYDWLTSPTGWGVWGDRAKNQNGLLYAVLTQPEITKLSFPDRPKITTAYMIYMQVGFGIGILRNLFWNAGA